MSGIDWTKLRDYPHLDPKVTSKGNLKVRCPFHSDRTPSAVIFPTGYFYCFGCETEGFIPKQIAEKILGGEIASTGTYVKEQFPSVDVVEEQSLVVQKAIRSHTGESLLVRSFATKKHLPVDVVRTSTFPTRQGLLMPAFCWAWGDERFDPEIPPYAEHDYPYPLYVCGAQYRIKDALAEDPELKAITHGFRGFGMPGLQYRPRWAWDGKVAAKSRYIIVTEGPQHAYKFAVALEGKALALCTFGGSISGWQEKAIESLSPDCLLVVQDSDKWRDSDKPENKAIMREDHGLEVNLYLDADLISPLGLRRVLQSLEIPTP